MTLRIQVTEGDVAGGCKLPSKCPVARAAARAGLPPPSVGLNFDAYCLMWAGGSTGGLNLNESVSAKIKTYDHTGEFRLPCEFDLEIEGE